MLLSFDFHYQTSKHHLHHKYISNFISSFPKTPKNQTSKLHLHHKYIHFQLWFISSFPTKHLPIEQNKTWTNKIKPIRKKKKKKKKKTNERNPCEKLCILHIFQNFNFLSKFMMMLVSWSSWNLKLIPTQNKQIKDQ